MPQWTAEAESHGHVRQTLQRVGRWHLYNTRPDNRVHGPGEEGPRTDLKDETRRVIDLITQTTKDPFLDAYSHYLGELYGYASYYQGYRWGFRLFNVSTAPPDLIHQKTLSFTRSLPLAALFGKEAMNTDYVRSGWPLQDTLSFRVGDTFTQSPTAMAGVLRVRIKRFDSFGEFYPGNDDLHPLRELFLAGLHSELFKAHRSGIVASCLKTSTAVNAKQYYRSDHANKSAMP